MSNENIYYYYLKPDDIIYQGDEVTGYNLKYYLLCESSIGHTVKHAFGDMLNCKVRRLIHQTKLGNHF